MSTLEAFLKRYPDGENLPQHCKDYYEIGFVDGEMFQFQITKSLEQQIQGHVLEVLKLRKELATLRQEKERGPFGEDVALATATRKIQVLRESLISLYKFGTMYTSPEHPIFTHARNLIERTK